MSKKGEDYNVTRREFLGTLGKRVAVGATVYGTIGGTIGHLYRAATGYLGNKLLEYDNAVKNSTSIQMAPVRGAQKLEDTRSKFWSKMFGVSEGDKAKNRQAYGIGDSKKDDQIIEAEASDPKNVSRRSFFGSLLGYAVRHPTETGIVSGATYGAVKAVPGAIKDAKTNSRVAGLEAKLDKIESDINASKIKPEMTKKEQEDFYESNINWLILGGIFSFIAFILLSSTDITGLAIVDKTALEYSGAFFLPLTVLLILFGVTRKTIKRRRI